MGFTITEKAVRRAGLDYWPYVELYQHKSFDEYLAKAAPSKLWLFSTHGTRLYTEVTYGPDDALVFGSETKGLGAAFLSQYPKDQILNIPIDCQEVRSLNLSNAASIALYEARRQLGR